MSLEQELREYFGSTKKRRTVIVGVGNPLRGDDAVGPRTIELLESKPLPNVLLLNTESVPEAFTGKIEKFKPTHVLIIDAANFGGAPGEAILITGEQIGGQAVSTHSLPLNIFISYIELTLRIKVLLLGVQPTSIVLGDPLSATVQTAVNSIVDTLYKLLSE
jgi:hydrogenase 3 maturation protease